MAAWDGASFRWSHSSSRWPVARALREFAGVSEPACKVQHLPTFQQALTLSDQRHIVKKKHSARFRFWSWRSERRQGAVPQCHCWAVATGEIRRCRVTSPLHSPDLAQLYFLFPRVKRQLNGRRFERRRHRLSTASSGLLASGRPAQLTVSKQEERTLKSIK